jgi:hypothetical protein
MCDIQCLYHVLADATVTLHLAFIAFVVAGSVLVFWWRSIAWLHIPALIWAALVELTGWICPLTPLEDRFRELSGQQPYAGDFVQQYVVALVYPAGLTRSMQIALGLAVLGLNALAYWIVSRRIAGRRRVGA